MQGVEVAAREKRVKTGARILAGRRGKKRLLAAAAEKMRKGTPRDNDELLRSVGRGARGVGGERETGEWRRKGRIREKATAKGGWRVTACLPSPIGHSCNRSKQACSTR